MLLAVQSNFASYFEAAGVEFERRGRGCLMCEWQDEANEYGVTTTYLTSGQLRSTVRDAKPLFAWFKKTARPAIQRYDPRSECVVITTSDDGGPQVSVLRVEVNGEQ